MGELGIGRGGGRFYAATNPASIPDIFLKETEQVAGQQIVEEPFFPIQTSSSPILRGIDQGFPQLLGYNGTTAKSAAQTVLVTARDDPFVAVEPLESFARPGPVQVEIIPQGGHLGFLGRNGAGGVRWLEPRIAQWLCAS